MILILSSQEDISTDNVCDWLDVLNVKYIRVHAKDLLGNLKKRYVGKNSKTLEFKNGKTINIPDIKVIWNRKWYIHENIDKVTYLDAFNNEKLNKVLVKENTTLNEYILSLFEDVKWVSHPSVTYLNKLKQLEIANTCGLLIPTTILVSTKDEVLSFHKAHKHIITKPLQSLLLLRDGDDGYASYTSRINEEHINQLPISFKPSLFQEEIKKDFEIRTVFVNNTFYSMAIFSQKDRQTEVDFRRYNRAIPNRNVPYKLPDYIEEKLLLFMKKTGLKSGSLDIIKSKGNYYFLEVNPVGQYGMTSVPCNYQLDKVFAEYLIELNHGE